MHEQDIEDVAKAIYWAAFEMYPHNANSRLDKDESWKRTSEEHRQLCRLQARRAIEAILPRPNPMSA